MELVVNCAFGMVGILCYDSVIQVVRMQLIIYGIYILLNVFALKIHSLSLLLIWIFLVLGFLALVFFLKVI